MFCQFILLMFIIHQADERQLSHARPEPAARLRRGDGRAQPHARGPQPVDHAAGGQQCAAAAARGAGRRTGARAPAPASSPRRARWRCGRPCATRCGSCSTRWRRASSTPAIADTTFVLAMADATAAELMPGPGPDRRAARRRGVSLRVLPLTTRDPRRMLEQEEVDMAIGYFPAVIASLTARGAVRRRRALRDPAAVCRPVRVRDAPAAIRWPTRPLTLDSFCAARHLLVSFSGRPYGFIDQTLGALGRERRIVVTVNQFFTAGRVVANSDLLTVLPRHFVARDRHRRPAGAARAALRPAAGARGCALASARAARACARLAAAGAGCGCGARPRCRGSGVSGRR